MEKTEFFQKAKDLIECCTTLYLATYNENMQSAETRAMANIRCIKTYPQNRVLFKEGDLSNYIVTGLCTEKVKELQTQKTVSVYYYCQEYYKTLTLFGTTELIDDTETKSRLWSDQWKMYFPKGKEDDSYALFKFNPKVAKYYDMKFDKIIMKL